MEELLKNGQITLTPTALNLLSQDQLQEFSPNDFVTLLYYLGITSIKSPMGEQITFTIPNYVIGKLYWKFFINLYILIFVGDKCQVCEEIGD